MIKAAAGQRWLSYTERFAAASHTISDDWQLGRPPRHQNSLVRLQEWKKVTWRAAEYSNRPAHVAPLQRDAFHMKRSSGFYWRQWSLQEAAALSEAWRYLKNDSFIQIKCGGQTLFAPKISLTQLLMIIGFSFNYEADIQDFKVGHKTIPYITIKKQKNKNFDFATLQAGKH